MRYVIDTNILINLITYLPEKYYPKFWSWLRMQVEKSQIIILDVVAVECQYGDIKRRAVKNY